MRPLLHPLLLNGRFGDPVLHVETLFEKHALLFDLGDIGALPPRKLLRIDHVFVSHTHIDHFIGFDHLLRLMVGRAKTVQLFGPPGFVAQVHHKLQAYQWNLVDRYLDDLVLIANELGSDAIRTVRFRFKRAFALEEIGRRTFDGVLHSEPTWQVTAAVLEHRTPCLAFALQETTHVNVWKTRLVERGLGVGPWLKELKRAIVESRADDFEIEVDGSRMRLGELRDLVTVAPGQKIAYVTDVADTPQNRAAIVALARDADVLFIEATFAQADAVLATERAHLTTTAAGELAREAQAKRVEPFHFSPRYRNEEARMLAEVAKGYETPSK